MNRTEMKGNWHVVKGRLKQQWGDLTDDDLTYEEGREDELYGRIGQKIGQSKDAVKRFIDNIHL